MEMEIILIVLLVFMIIGALIAVETKTLLSSVISLGAVGVGLSIAFLFLGAPDLALVQIGVEVVLLVFLIRATIGRDIVPEEGRVRWFGIAIVIVLLAALLYFAVSAFRSLQAFGVPIISILPGAPSNHYLRSGLKQTGAANIVTSVILDYRAYDTLGEATVLFTAILGALAVLRGRSRSHGEGKDE